MFLNIFLLLIGLAILILGAEIMVRGASSLAKKMGVAPIVIGLTIVAFGTSAPELVVNLFSAFRGSSDLAIGNVVGSNIANVLLILGIATMIYPLKVKGNTVWREIPFAILAMVLLLIMGNDMFFDKVSYNAVTRTDGLALMGVFAIFMFYIFSLAKNEEKPEEVSAYSWSMSIFLTLAGIICLFFGGKILVENATSLARMAGLSEALIGLTVVVIGTSLPELVTSVVAAYHHHDDIAIGNIVGSNIFNVFWILGLTATIIPLPFNPAINVDILVGLLSVVLLFAFMFIGRRHRLDRWQGGVAVLLYIAYIAFLIIRG
jgi:cation:H+ antiporter